MWVLLLLLRLEMSGRKDVVVVVVVMMRMMVVVRMITWMVMVMRWPRRAGRNVVRVSGHGRSIHQHSSESSFRINGHRFHDSGLMHMAMVMVVLRLVLVMMRMMAQLLLLLLLLLLGAVHPRVVNTTGTRQREHARIRQNGAHHSS